MWPLSSVRTDLPQVLTSDKLPFKGKTDEEKDAATCAVNRGRRGARSAAVHGELSLDQRPASVDHACPGNAVSTPSRRPAPSAYSQRSVAPCAQGVIDYNHGESPKTQSVVSALCTVRRRRLGATASSIRRCWASPRSRHGPTSAAIGVPPLFWLWSLTRSFGHTRPIARPHGRRHKSSSVPPRPRMRLAGATLRRQIPTDKRLMGIEAIKKHEYFSGFDCARAIHLPYPTAHHVHAYRPARHVDVDARNGCTRLKARDQQSVHCKRRTHTIDHTPGDRAQGSCHPSPNGERCVP